MLLTVLASTLGGDPTTVEDKRSAISIGGLLSFVLVIFGIVGATGEYRHRTVAPAVLIAPDRARLLLARAFAYGVTALLVGLLMLVVAFVVGIPLLAGTDGPGLVLSDYLELAGGGLLSAALSAILGVGAGALIGNQVAGVVGALVFFFIIEPLAPLVSDDLQSLTIGQAQVRLGGVEVVPSSAFLAALGVLVAWTLLFLLLGVSRERGREVS
ncbi:MAG: ABC transporter permease [Thermoleophilaceae bacterium]